MNMSEASRRNLLKFGAAAVPALALGSLLPATARAATSPTGVQLRMPAEDGRHLQTFMAWPALSAVWGNALSGVRNDIAYQISRYEPVVMLARPGQAAGARYACGNGAYYSITAVEIANDDLWIRYFGPTFLTDPGVIAGLDTNFNGWGKTGTTYYPPFANDAAAAAPLLDYYGIQRVQAAFVGEGGSLETDGEGALLATVSSLLNPNRNPGKTQAQVEQDLKSSLGVDKVIWVPGLGDPRTPPPRQPTVRATGSTRRSHGRPPHRNHVARPRHGVHHPGRHRPTGSRALEPAPADIPDGRGGRTRVGTQPATGVRT
ncbi:agmatine/peptidylarginine deiminase [Streptomyces sp. NPDC093089]|uniref:agmatine deiminase family protein n=1 Tax=Streptomyces sp. NPDC093089 TaxID=3366024 RepID=UPI0037FFF27D